MPGREAARPSPLTRLDDWLATTRGTVLSCAVVLLLSWPVAIVSVDTGVDTSYRAALSMAGARGLRFGKEFVYTYGPLGFLNQPALFDGGRGLVAILAALAVNVALVVTVVVLLRRSFAPLVSIAIAVVILSAAGEGHLTKTLELILILWALVALTGRQSPHRLAEIALVGAASGVALVIKNDAVGFLGLALYAVVVTAALSSGRRAVARDVTVFGGTALGGFVVSWALAGQHFSDLRSYLAAARQYALGYSTAMGIEDGRTTDWMIEYLFAAVIAALFVYWTLNSRAIATMRRVAVAGFLLLLFFVEFKYGFVRHDDVHSTTFFIAASFIPVALAPVWGRRRALVAMAAGMLVVVLALQSGSLDRFDPVAHAESIVDVAKLTVSSSERDRFIEEARSQLRGGFGVPPEMIEQLRGHSTHLAPSDAGVAFAYPQIDWAPLPTLQAYAAYTPYLDDLDADRLAGPDRPDRVLRRFALSIDGRLVRFESPHATFALLCHYREIDQRGRWQLLAATEDQCGRPRSLGTRRARLGETVDVPTKTGAMTVARFHGLGTSPVDKIRTIAWKPREFFVTTAGNRFRYPVGNQEQIHVLSVPPCGPSPDQQARRELRDLRVTDRYAIPKLDAAADDYSVEFFAVPYEC